MKLKKDVVKDISRIFLTVFFLLYIIIPVNGWLKSKTKIAEAKDVRAESITAPSPSVTPTPPGVPDGEEYKALIYKIFGEKEGKIAIAIAQCESNLHADRIHKDDIEWSIGLFQINIRKGNGEGPLVHWNKIPGATGEEKEAWLMIPENNILIAKFIHGSSGWWPWSCYSKKGYLKYY